MMLFSSLKRFIFFFSSLSTVVLCLETSHKENTSDFFCTLHSNLISPQVSEVKQQEQKQIPVVI